MNDSGVTKKRAMVTGASGYIGTKLVRYLLEHGWRVDIIVRPSSDLSGVPKKASEMTVHHYTGRLDEVRKALDSSKPDVVFHLAALFISEHDPEDVDSLIESNIRFGAQVLEAMSLHDVKNLINVGTSWQHYNNERFNPVNLYAAFKQAFECIAKYYVEAHKIKLLTLLLFDTYGPADKRKKLVPYLFDVAKGKEVLKLSPGDQLIDLVYIDDVVEAFERAADRILGSSSPVERFGVGSGCPLSLKEVVSTFEEATNCTLSVRWGERQYREREVMKAWSNYQTLPGWTSQTTLLDGFLKICRLDNLEKTKYP